MDEKEEIVQPAFQKEKVLVITKFVNQSKDPDLDLLENTIPQFLIDDLAKIEKIRLSHKYIALSNKSAILNAYSLVQQMQSEQINETIDDITSMSKDSLKKPIKFKPKPKPKSNTNKEKIDSAKSSIDAEKKETRIVQNYVQFYQKNKPPFKSYLGLNIDKPIDLLSSTYKLKVNDSILALKSDKVFQISSNYEQLLKSPADLIYLGVITKQGEKIIVQIKLYDKYLNKFIYSKSFPVNKSNFLVQFEKEIKKVSQQLTENLTQFPKGKLIVKTEPQGAYIFLNNQKIGISNLNKDLPFGFYKVEILKQNYKKIKGEIYVTEGKTNMLEFKLFKRREFGSVDILSIPSGADVFFDLDYKGTTPLSLDNIRAGTYKIRLEKKGYEYGYTHVNVKNKKRYIVNFEMKKGETKYQEVEKLSETYNVFKNVFFYSSFVSMSALLYAYLQTNKYQDRAIAETTSLTRFAEYKSKYEQSNKIKTATLISTISLIALTAIFQLLELHAENIEVGFTPKDDKSHKNSIKENDIGANFSIQLKF
ncbi:MAG: PEGA domain-containing protein [Spirochaetota bacterium]|nr:PEGA domain-containing protein [Spirochaetota bacterium]